jgi:hypothetical protein
MIHHKLETRHSKLGTQNSRLPNFLKNGHKSKQARPLRGQKGKGKVQKAKDKRQTRCARKGQTQLLLFAPCYLPFASRPLLVASCILPFAF